VSDDWPTEVVDRDPTHHDEVLVSVVGGFADDIRSLNRRTRLTLVALGALVLLLLLAMTVTAADLHGRVDEARSRAETAEATNAALVDCLRKPTRA
jgi:hypothetical protein